MKSKRHLDITLFELSGRKWPARLLRATAFAVLAIASVPLALPGAVADGSMLVYPAQGQSPEQQKQDEFECHDWAVGQTGFDPTKNQTPPPQQAKERGGAVRGAAGGALVGLGVGAIAGNAGKGAAIGAGAGAVAGGARQMGRNEQKQAANQQAQADYNARLQQYNKAKMVCLEGRGYTVK